MLVLLAFEFLNENNSSQKSVSIKIQRRLDFLNYIFCLKCE